MAAVFAKINFHSDLNEAYLSLKEIINQKYGLNVKIESAIISNPLQLSVEQSYFCAAL